MPSPTSASSSCIQDATNPWRSAFASASGRRGDGPRPLQASSSATWLGCGSLRGPRPAAVLFASARFFSRDRRRCAGSLTHVLEDENRAAVWEQLGEEAAAEAFAAGAALAGRSSRLRARGAQLAGFQVFSSGATGIEPVTFGLQSRISAFRAFRSASACFRQSLSSCGFAGSRRVEPGNAPNGVYEPFPWQSISSGRCLVRREGRAEEPAARRGGPGVGSGRTPGRRSLVPEKQSANVSIRAAAGYPMMAHSSAKSASPTAWKLVTAAYPALATAGSPTRLLLRLTGLLTKIPPTAGFSYSRTPRPSCITGASPGVRSEPGKRQKAALEDLRIDLVGTMRCEVDVEARGGSGGPACSASSGGWGGSFRLRGRLGIRRRLRSRR